MNKRQAKKKIRGWGVTAKRRRALRRRAIEKVKNALTERTKEAVDEAVTLCFWAYVFTGKKIPGEDEVLQIYGRARREERERNERRCGDDERKNRGALERA